MDNEKSDEQSPVERDSSPALVSDAPEGRSRWTGQLDFVLACIGYAVGLGNVWRFPYLCYKNGGGAFLIPYFLMLVCGALPVLLLEIGLGQYMSKGGLKSWIICPLFQGIGLATLLIDILCSTYYIVILAWGLYYLYVSLRGVLLWETCGNAWNTDRCALSNREYVERLCSPENQNQSNSFVNLTLLSNNSLSNFTLNTTVANCSLGHVTPIDPAVEFWENHVIQITDSIENGGGLVPHLSVCLLLMWIVIYFCVWRGIKWSGKIVYFTATFPYVILFILLGRGLTLPGAGSGIMYFLKPDFSRLLDAQVWIDGGTQVFFSTAIALGAMISLGSYNTFNTDFYKRTLIVAGVNSGTSILSGFVVFSVLGFMAQEQKVDISEVAKSGPGLVFIVYPKAVTLMPLPQLWSILFFFMLFLIGIDSQFVQVESALTHVSDIFPRQLSKTKIRMILTAVACILWFLMSLSMVTRGGMYVFQLYDYYSTSGMVMLWVCFWECIVIGWIFGSEKFNDAIELMIGYRINKWFHFCWKYITPLVTTGIFLFQVVGFKPLKYNNVYEYPPWAQAIGLMLALVSMICIPIFIGIKLLAMNGTFKERLKKAIIPQLTKDQLSKKWLEKDNESLLQNSNL
nr:sodium- and chloride-dependent creatine transporter 1-like isoform X2 [Crassostrea virginica]